MDDLTAFLTARLDETEAAAKAATDGPWYQEDMQIRGHNRAYSGGDPGILVVRHTWPQEAAHITRHDPARVLRDVEADRSLLAEWRKAEADPAVDDQWNAGLAAGLRLAVQIRAARHSDHPDYRPEWKP